MRYCVACDTMFEDDAKHECFKFPFSSDNCWDEDSWNAAIEAAAIKAQDNGAMLLAQEIRKLKK